MDTGHLMKLCVCVCAKKWGRCGINKKMFQHTISIHLVDHVLQLSFSGVLSQRPHHCAQLFGGDCAIAILVKQGECLLELCTNK